MDPTLKIVLGPNKGCERKISANVFLIGRHDSNDLIVKDVFISSFHCEIKLMENGSFRLYDKSSNGTWVNGCNVHNKSVVLRDKSTIGVGPLLLLFEYNE